MAEGLAPIGRLALAVFSAGSRSWSVGELLAHAPQLGDCDPAPAARVRSPESATLNLDGAVEAFRYRHDLVSADECVAWLTLRGLSYGDLRSSLRRQLSGESAGNSSAGVIDCMLSERFSRLSLGLATRVACAVDAGCLPSGDLGPHWDALERCYQLFLADTFEQHKRQRVLDQDRLTWLKVDAELIEFDTLNAAREAKLCVTEDGMLLNEVAREGGLAYQAGCWFMRELKPAWAQALSRIAGGSVSVPIADGERWLLLGLTRYVEPSLDDPQVLAGIDALLLNQARQALISRHIRWALVPD